MNVEIFTRNNGDLGVMVDGVDSHFHLAESFSGYTLSDGENEPVMLDSREAVIDEVKRQWKQKD